MADDASIRVLAEPNILLPNQGFIDMYNMPNKWLQIHSSRHRTTQASSIFVLLSAFQLLLFASSLCCTACRIQTKQKKVATVAKNVCQATELGLQYQPFDIHSQPNYRWILRKQRLWNGWNSTTFGEKWDIHYSQEEPSSGDSEEAWVAQTRIPGELSAVVH